MPAKAQGIAHGIGKGCRSSLVGDDVQVAFLIGLFVMDGRRDVAFLQGLDRDDRFDGSAGAQQMSGVGLGG